MGSAGPPRERGGAPPGPDKGRDTRSAPPGQNKALISCPARPHSFGIGAGFWDRRRALGSALGSTPQLWDRLWDQPRDLGSAPGSAPAFGIGPRYGPAVSPRGPGGVTAPPPPPRHKFWGGGWGLPEPLPEGIPTLRGGRGAAGVSPPSPRFGDIAERHLWGRDIWGLGGLSPPVTPGGLGGLEFGDTLELGRGGAGCAPAGR